MDVRDAGVRTETWKREGRLGFPRAAFIRRRLLGGGGSGRRGRVPERRYLTLGHHAGRALAGAGMRGNAEASTVGEQSKFRDYHGGHFASAGIALRQGDKRLRPAGVDLELGRCQRREVPDRGHTRTSRSALRGGSPISSALLDPGTPLIRLPFALHAANEALAFLLELVMLLALGWWGAKSGATLAGAVLLGAGAPLAVAIVWGLFAAPKARIRLPIGGILAVKAVAFGSAAAAIYALGLHTAAAVFAVVSFANATLAAFDRHGRQQERGPQVLRRGTRVDAADQ